MTKKQVQRYIHIQEALTGISVCDIDRLLRAQKALRAWSEHECNGEIQRDEETNIPYWYNTYTGKRAYRTADRETGALRRIERILSGTGWAYYVQGDPRGCSLYLYRPEALNSRDIHAYYSSIGVAMCID